MSYSYHRFERNFFKLLTIISVCVYLQNAILVIVFSLSAISSNFQLPSKPIVVMDCVVQGYLMFLLGSGIFIGLLFVCYVLYVLNKLVKNKGEIKQFSSTPQVEIPGASYAHR